MSNAKFAIAIYYLVPVLHALVVGIKGVKRTEKKTAVLQLYEFEF